MTSIKPNFSETEIITFLSEHYDAFQVPINGKLKPLAGYCDQNLLLTLNSGQKFIIKVANTEEPEICLSMQNEAMQRLTDKGLPVPHAITNNSGDSITTIRKQAHCFYLRVLSFLPGKFYADYSPEQHNEKLWGDLGKFAAHLVNGLSDFSHIGAHRYLEWDLANGLRVCLEKKHHLNETQEAMVDKFLSIYKSQVLPRTAELSLGVIHNDANDYNLLVDIDESTQNPISIKGLIDFGDMVFSHQINELAITCAYALLSQNDPISTLINIVKGYHTERSLELVEIEVLLPLIALRLCTSVCNSALAIKEQPDNDYLLISAKPAWELLSILKDINNFSVVQKLKAACLIDTKVGKSKEAITAYRQTHLSKNLSLSYNEPLKIVNGKGAYLYDENGTAYLDMVNNVCHVGHCHPKVVEAGQTQMSKLNTNTRYLHDNIINFSEKLLATMPKELSVCMFVNSGSEANELAFRLAKSYAKYRGNQNKELLVVDGAYHGNTSACIDASSYKFDGPGGEGCPEHTHKVKLPDPYRGECQSSGAEQASYYAGDVKHVIEQLSNEGKAPYAFICESLQGVAGQIIMPEGYLKQAYEHVRQASGVCIADEVQVGFGRVGTHMWAFQTQDVVPDIVTLGKPIGNGHPLGAVITTPEIAKAFETGMEYFNTFGGNPVSCAIGTAVLDVIENENLKQNAEQVGRYMREEVKNLQQEFPVIGDVRGLGLFVGVELVENQATKEPATAKTAELVEYFKTQNILLSTEGPFYNVLKIKPPIVFSKRDCDKFLVSLRQGLARIS